MFDPVDAMVSHDAVYYQPNPPFDMHFIQLAQF